VVPENVHTPPTEGIENSWGWGVLKGQKLLEDAKGKLQSLDG